MADATPTQCFVVAAIDLPLHGITSDDRPDEPTVRVSLRPARPQNRSASAHERTFNVDLEQHDFGRRPGRQDRFLRDALDQPQEPAELRDNTAAG